MFVPIGLVNIFVGFLKFVADFAVVMKSVGGLPLLQSIMTHRVVSASSVFFGLTGLQVILFGMLADAILRKIDQRTLRGYEPIGSRTGAMVSDGSDEHPLTRTTAGTSTKEADDSL